MSKPKKKEYGASLNGNTAWPVVAGEPFTRRDREEAWRVWERLKSTLVDERSRRVDERRVANAWAVWNWIWAYSGREGVRDRSARGLMWVDYNELEAATGHKGGKWLHSKSALQDLHRVRLIVYEHDAKDRGVVFLPALHVVSFDSERAPRPDLITPRDDLAPVRAYLGFSVTHDRAWEAFSALHHDSGYAQFSKRSMSTWNDHEWGLIKWLTDWRLTLGNTPGPRLGGFSCSSAEEAADLRDRMMIWIYAEALGEADHDVLHWETLLHYEYNDKGTPLVDWEPFHSADLLRKDEKSGRHYLEVELGGGRSALWVWKSHVELFKDAA